METDVVRVVRCRYCQHGRYNESVNNYSCRKAYGVLRHASDFCSRGELKETYETDKNKISQRR